MDATTSTMPPRSAATPPWVDTIGVLGPFPGHHAGGARATRRMLDLADVRPGSRVLVIGCGDGATALRVAADRRVHVVGTDVNPRAIDEARAALRRSRRLEGTVAFEVDDVLDTRLERGSFDRILVESVLIMLDKGAALGAMKSLLAPGGKLVVAESTRLGGDEAKVRGLRATFGAYGIDWDLPSPDDWHAAIERAGLSVERETLPTPTSLTWLGFESFLRHPAKVSAFAIRALAARERWALVWRIVRDVRRARLRWAYGIWVCTVR